MKVKLHKVVFGAILLFGFQQINAQSAYPGIPYSGSAIQILGTGSAEKVELENFDSYTTTGDDGKSIGAAYNTAGKDGTYNDSSAGNTGGSTYRSADVDLVDAGTGVVITGTGGGDYTCYTVNFAKSGNYHANVNYRVFGAKHFQIFFYQLNNFDSFFKVGYNTFDSGQLAATGGAYVDSGDGNTFSLNAGTYVVAVVATSGGPNFDFISFTYEGVTTPTTNTWDGSSSPDWNDAANWSAGVPTDTHNVTIPSGMPNDPLIIDATDASVNDLTIDASATLTLNTGGSLTVNGTSITNGEVIYNRTITKDANNDFAWYSVSSPLSNVTAATLRSDNNFAAGTGGSRIGLATYNNSTPAWAYFTSSSSDAIAPGTGLSAKLNNASITDDLIFKGAHTSGNIEPSISQGTNNFNFVGNPYSAYVNLGTFFTENSATNRLSEQTIWIWDENKDGVNTGGYVQKMFGTDAAYEIAPGQGFFVSAGSAASNKVIFHQSNLSHQSDSFLKTSGRTEVRLNVTQGNLKNQAKIYYIEGTTTDFDNGFDGSLFGGVGYDLAVYTGLVSGNQQKKIGTQSLPNSNYGNMIVPVGVIAKANKEISFSAEALNLPSDIKVFLEDRLTNTFTRLDVANANYKVTVGEALNGIGRFYLHTAQKALSVDNNIALDNISIYKTNNATLRITGLQQGNANVKLYSVLGKQVMSSTFKSNGVKDISLPKLATGVYIVQLETVAGKLNKKIILE